MNTYVLILMSETYSGYTAFHTKMTHALLRIFAHYVTIRPILVAIGPGNTEAYVRRYAKIMELPIPIIKRSMKEVNLSLSANYCAIVVIDGMVPQEKGWIEPVPVGIPIFKFHIIRKRVKFK